MSININHSKNTISTSDKLVLDNDNISVSNSRVEDVQDPVNAQDAVNKQYLDAIVDSITSITDLLIPVQAPTIDTFTLDLLSEQSYRITDVSQTDNTNTGLGVTPGTVVNNVLRNNDYRTNLLSQVGPGDNGTLSIVRNGNTTSQITFDSENNTGLYTDIDSINISNNVDYGTVTGDATGFSQCYDVRVSGNNVVPEGWNSLKLTHDDNETNTVVWYCDLSNPPVPTVTQLSVTPDPVEYLTYSSSVPHYTSAQIFNVTFDVANLSGDFYPTSDTFFSASNSVSSLSALSSLGDLSYTGVGMPSPLPQNYLTDGSTFSIATSTSVRSGTGVGMPGNGPTASITNSYYTADYIFAPIRKVLYMDPFDTTVINEQSIRVENVGYGSGNGYRLETISEDTPSYTGPAYDSENTELMSWDAVVVGGVLSHDTTDYTNGYYPVGPDLSAGRSNPQYFEFAFNRSGVSKFGIKISGQISGCWVNLPGTTIDTSSSENGWINATVPYNGSGIPGDIIANGGNGSNGCALGSTMTVGSIVSDETTIVTFGTESSSSSIDNMIRIRFKLTSGDILTHVSIVSAN